VPADPPSRITAQDACPGAVAVHQAADGGLARVRVPGGQLTGAQWEELLAASHDLGDGSLDLTSRGNVQIRGLSAGAEVELARRLWQAGLLPSVDHERARNIVASPLTGLDNRGLIDIRPMIRELDEALCATASLAELSGRFLFALDDGRCDVLPLAPDIAACAIGPGEMTLLVAGIDSGKRFALPAIVAAMLDEAEAFLAERAAQGSNAWRIHELRSAPTSVDFWSPGNHNSTLTGAVGEVVQADGRVALVVGAPLGRLTAGQAGALSNPRLVVTPWRGVVLADLTQAEANERATELARLGLILDPESPWLGVTACTGRPGCAKALADVRCDAATVHRREAAAPALPVHWVGCERRCGTPSGQSIEVLATAAGYLVSGEPGGALAAAIERNL
jgi:precorrin-3B synthase